MTSLALGVLAFGMYLFTCAPSTLFGDGGEFQFVPYIAGIAHPTGYPLYVLLGWAWSHAVPLGDVAYRMNLFSAFWAALTVGFAYPVTLYVIGHTAPRLHPTASRLSAITAVATFAVGQTFWSQAIIAEIYSLHAFFVVLVFFFLFRLMDNPFSLRRGLVLAFVYGLSLTHHRTMLLLAPGIVVAIWISHRKSRKKATAPLTRHHLLKWLTTGLVLLVALVAPLLLYLYLPLRAPFVPYATLHLSDTQILTLYPNNWRGFVDHLFANVFTGNLEPFDIDWGQRLGLAWELLRQQLGLVGIGLGLAGLTRLIFSRQRALLALTILSYVCLILFNAIYLIGDVEVLFIPSYLVFSLWIGLGVATIAQLTAATIQMLANTREEATPAPTTDKQTRFRDWLTIGLTGLSLLLPLALLITHLPQVDRSRDSTAAAMWEPILGYSIPQNSVLISNDRDEMMPLWYYQYVEGRRPDLVGLFPQIVTNPSYANLGGVIEQASLSGRPVYLTKPMPGLELKAQLQPVPEMPPLVELTGLTLESSDVHTRQVTLDGKLRLVGYDQRPSNVQPGSPLTVTLHWQPQQEMEHDYTSYVHLVDADNQRLAQSDHQPGGIYYPSSSWRPGEVLLDSHVLTIPHQTPTGTYQLTTGMYRYPSMESLGGPVELGLVAVKDADQLQTDIPEGVQHALETVFDGRIALLGFDQKLSGDNLDLTLYWQAESPVVQNWSVLLQLVNHNEMPVDQQEGQAQGGDYPTSVWEPGEVVEDSHVFRLPDYVPDGDFELRVSLYLPQNGQHLPILDSTGNPVDDNALLITLTRSNGVWQTK